MNTNKNIQKVLWEFCLGVKDNPITEDEFRAFIRLVDNQEDDIYSMYNERFSNGMSEDAKKYKSEGLEANRNNSWLKNFVAGYRKQSIEDYLKENLSSTDYKLWNSNFKQGEPVEPLPF